MLTLHYFKKKRRSWPEHYAEIDGKPLILMKKVIFQLSRWIFLDKEKQCFLKSTHGADFAQKMLFYSVMECQFQTIRFKRVQAKRRFENLFF